VPLGEVLGEAKKIQRLGAKLSHTIDAAGDARKAPNPYGRRGDPVTQDTVKRVQKSLERKGFDLEDKEYRFKKGADGLKDRYADVTAMNEATQEAVVINIGLKRKDGLPISRERKALHDIHQSSTLQKLEKSGYDVDVIFIEKGSKDLSELKL